MKTAEQMDQEYQARSALVRNILEAERRAADAKAPRLRALRIQTTDTSPKCRAARDRDMFLARAAGTSLENLAARYRLALRTVRTIVRLQAVLHAPEG